MRTRLRSSDVFINCPFDAGYRAMDDAAEFRLSKIERIIEECRLGINDLSTVELDPVLHLPRFNMPLELGLFLGCKRFGGKDQARKKCLILDSDQHRYRGFISDIAGQDIRAHAGDPERAIREVRDWVEATSRRTGLPGGGEMVERYKRFQSDLPSICAELKLDAGRLTFLDLSNTIAGWLRASR